MLFPAFATWFSSPSLVFIFSPFRIFSIFHDLISLLFPSSSKYSLFCPVVCQHFLIFLPLLILAYEPGFVKVRHVFRSAFFFQLLPCKWLVNLRRNRILNRNHHYRTNHSLLSIWGLLEVMEEFYSKRHMFLNAAVGYFKIYLIFNLDL